MLQSRIKQLEDLLTGERKDLLRSSVFLSRIRKVRSEIHLTNSRTWYQTKARNISQIFRSFCQLNSRYGLFKSFQFPAKKLRKIRAHISLSFLWVTSVQMWRIFPQKIRRLKYACANFFLKKICICAGHISVVNKLNIYQLVVLLWYHYLFTNEKSVKLLSCNKHSINISSFISHFICFNSLWQVN